MAIATQRAAVVAGIDSFEGRSKQSTWVFGILLRQSARRWRGRHTRDVPLPLNQPGQDSEHSRQIADESAWSDPQRLTESRISSDIAMRSIATLPERYRIIITMRDIRGCSAAEAETALGISSANQRVLLHRARSKVRRTMVALGVSHH